MQIVPFPNSNELVVINSESMTTVDSISGTYKLYTYQIDIDDNYHNLAAFVEDQDGSND